MDIRDLDLFMKCNVDKVASETTPKAHSIDVGCNYLFMSQYSVSCNNLSIRFFAW